MSLLIDNLIDDIREATENETFDDTTGLTEEEILRYINDAQRRLHAKVVARHPEVFSVVETQSVVSDQEAYTLNFNSYLNNKVLSVEYSQDGSTDNFYMLRRVSPKLRDTGSNGSPDSYFLQAGQIFLTSSPQNSSGSLRITYIRKVRALDKRRYLISDATPLLSASDVWTTSVVNGSVDSTVIGTRNKVTVVDTRGSVQASNVNISANGSTSVTIDSGYTATSSDSVAQNNYVVSGEFTSTHLDDVWGEDIERYLRSYAEWKVLKRDSSIDSAEAVQELLQMESEILDSYANVTEDIQEIPEINNSEDWWLS